MSTISSEPPADVSRTPPLVLASVLLGLAVLVWPSVLGRVISLDWKLRNMRPVARGIACALVGLSFLIVLARRPIAAGWAHLFPTRKRLLFAALTAGISILLSVLAVEIGLRLAGLPFRMTKPASETAIAQFDAELGWTYIPNLSAVQEFGADHRKIALHFDDIGSRVRAPGVRHDPAKPSILFVGCSFTMGHGVAYEDSFVGRLEAMPDFPFQAVNLGVQGYGTDQSMLMLKRQFARFPTRAVVYTLIDNHVYRNQNYDRRMMLPNLRFLGTKPLFGLHDDGTLYLRKPAVLLQDFHYSRVGVLFKMAYARYGPRPTDALTLALIQEMRSYVESHGAVFIVLYWTRAEKGPLAIDIGRDAQFHAMNLHLVDTSVGPPPGWDDWSIPGDSHPDARGHAYVAELMRDALARWVPQ